MCITWFPLFAVCLHGQFCGYLKILFYNVTRRYDTKQLLPDVIKHEAIQAWADIRCQKYLCGRPNCTKNYLRTSYEFYQVSWSLSESVLVHSTTLSVASVLSTEFTFATYNNMDLYTIYGLTIYNSEYIIHLQSTCNSL